MTKEIHYIGMTANTSDYECPDGALDVSLNAISENDALRPLLQPLPVDIGLTADQYVAYIHKPTGYKHYIVVQGTTARWVDADDTSVNGSLSSFGSAINQITSIGNTLVVLCDNGMHYFLWKPDDKAYLYLGTQMPELSLSFGLQGEMKRTDEFDISFTKMSVADTYYEFEDTQKTEITAAVLAKVNKFIAEESVQKGKFIYPFLVRYAYRLYDGTLTRHSAPVLMVASTSVSPRVFWYNLHGSDEHVNKATLRVVAPVHSLDVSCLTNTNNLANWEDIIKSVDIFISSPIYTYDQNGECTQFHRASDSSGNALYDGSPGDPSTWGYAVCKQTNQALDEETYPLRYQKRYFARMYSFAFTPEEPLQVPGGIVAMPTRGVDQVKEDIRNCCNFYLLHSYHLDELTPERTVIPVADDYLQSLNNRERMTDDYDSHDKLVPTQAFPFNARVNLSGIKKQLFQGFDGNALFCHTDGFVTVNPGSSPTAHDIVASVFAYVYIKENGRTIIVRGDAGTCCYAGPLLFFYYPNPNAYKAVIVRATTYDAPKLVIDLEQHAFLNGAFYFGGWNEPEGVSQARPVQSTDAERVVDLPNKVYTSEINNPFHFPVTGINTVGTGKILGISTAAKALSQGQFGQFPLYAFTDEGVWALEINSQGTYSARQPITRDVCTDPGGITQIDSAVLFPTDRGIMLITGSETKCITDVVATETPFNALGLPGMDTLHAMLGHGEDTCLPVLPFREYLQGCGMLYDYVNQHIIVYRSGTTYAYVFSLRSQQWGMMHSSIRSGVNSYPEALAVDTSGRLLNYSDAAGSEARKALIVTRPLKLGMPDTLKTVDTIIQRGTFPDGAVAQVLYGSRDLYHWHPVWTSRDRYMRGFRGTGYKYFRLAIVADLKKGESLYGATVSYSPRQTDQPR